MDSNVTISELPSITNVFNSKVMSLNSDDSAKDLLGCGAVYWLATNNKEKPTELYDVFSEGFVYYHSYNNFGIRVVLTLKPGLQTKTTSTGNNQEDAYIIL